MLSAGEREHSRALRVHYLPNDLDRPRLGLVVPKRIAARAADRNRIKRVARESFRALAAALPPLDLVLVARAGAEALERAALRRACDGLFSKLARN